MSPDHEIRLGVGDNGPAVADVQQRLELLSFSPGMDPEGSYKDGTRAAVEAFQYIRDPARLAG